jgi:hypothetical protein
MVVMGCDEIKKSLEIRFFKESNQKKIKMQWRKIKNELINLQSHDVVAKLLQHRRWASPSRWLRRGKINNNENDLTCSSLFHFAQLCMLASLPADWKRYIQFHFLLIFQATLSALTRLPTRPSFQLIFIPSHSLFLHITCFDWSIRCESLFSAVPFFLHFFYDFRCLRENIFNSPKIHCKCKGQVNMSFRVMMIFTISHTQGD